MVGFLLFQIVRYSNLKAELELNEKKIQTLPHIQLATADSTTLYDLNELSNNEPLVLIYFHPECEYCSAEINELLREPQKLAGIKNIFVTFAPREKVAEFLITHPIEQIENSIILFDDKYVFAGEYGIQSPPQTLVYDSNKQLIKHFRRVITIEALEQVLPDL